MRPQDLAFIADLVRRRSGLVLPPGKEYLVEARLADILLARNLESMDELVRIMRAQPDADLAEQVTEAMTTNETFFFRDRTQFDLLSTQLLPELARSRAGEAVRIWCAACSTGQEAYSLAMLAGGTTGPRSVTILASDLSEACLQKAQGGLYSKFEVQRGLSDEQLARHFEPEKNGWRASARLRASVAWRRFNLLDDPRALGQFDIVFCRNVLLYFDTATKKAVLNHLASVVAEDGYLLLATTEIARGLSDAFRPLEGRQGVFQRTSRSAETGARLKRTAAEAVEAAGSFGVRATVHHPKGG